MESQGGEGRRTQTTKARHDGFPSKQDDHKRIVDLRSLSRLCNASFIQAYANVNKGISMDVIGNI